MIKNVRITKFESGETMILNLDKELIGGVIVSGCCHEILSVFVIYNNLRTSTNREPDQWSECYGWGGRWSRRTCHTFALITTLDWQIWSKSGKFDMFANPLKESRTCWWVCNLWVMFWKCTILVLCRNVPIVLYQVMCERIPCKQEALTKKCLPWFISA